MLGLAAVLAVLGILLWLAAIPLPERLQEPLLGYAMFCFGGALAALWWAALKAGGAL